MYWVAIDSRLEHECFALQSTLGSFNRRSYGMVRSASTALFTSAVSAPPQHVLLDCLQPHNA